MIETMTRVNPMFHLAFYLYGWLIVYSFHQVIHTTFIPPRWATLAKTIMHNLTKAVKITGIIVRIQFSGLCWYKYLQGCHRKLLILKFLDFFQVFQIKMKSFHGQYKICKKILTFRIKDCKKPSLYIIKNAKEAYIVA